MRALLPVDLQQNNASLIAAAARWASQLAGRGDAVVVDLLTVDETPIPLPHTADAQVQAVLKAQWDRQHAERLAALAALRDELPVAHRGGVFERAGPAATTIAEVAESYDLVLIGTSQRQGVERLWLGSVAERVVRFSPRPVLVVPFPRPS